MRGLIAKIKNQTGWRAGLLCFASGAFLTLGYAPYHFWPVIFVSFPVFYWMIESTSSGRSAAWRGFMFGYGHAIAGTWWIANALLVDADKFGWLIPFCVLGLSAVMALWMVLFSYLAYRFRSGVTWRNMLRFTVIWVVIEIARSLGMFGFPWNLAGSVALASIQVSQVAAIAGVYGLSFMVMMAGLSPVLWPVRRLAVIVLPLLILGGGYVYGALRIPGMSVETETTLRLVQPNIAQSLKWTQDGKLESLQIHAELTRSKEGESPPDIVIWSETAFPYTMHDDALWPKRLATLLAPGQMLITGVVRQDDSAQTPKVTNSLIMVDAEGTLHGSYAKHQLVPFGEFVPFRDVLPIDKITPGNIDFSRGVGAQTLRSAHVPAFSPLICYEVIFPWLAVNGADRPEWILNVTNDAWYGDSPGPYQHFDAARMRAIEQGLPVVRVANNGISGVIDPYGRVLGQLNLGERGVMDAKLPRPTNATFNSTYGIWVIFLLLLPFALATYLLQRTIKDK